MAAPALMPRRPLLSDVLLLVALAGLLPARHAAAMFRGRDLLPLLPERVASPVMSHLPSAADFLPSFIAYVAPGGPTATWSASCFSENVATLTLNPDQGNGTGPGAGLGGALINIKTSSARSWTCMDVYVFATPYRVNWDYYIMSRNHTLEISSWAEPAELDYVKQNGVAIFLMPVGMLPTLLSLADVIPLFDNTLLGQISNLAFMEKRMKASFVKRFLPWSVNITKDDMHTGDFLAISKIRGRWGTFETLEKWVTGAFAGHAAVCLKDDNGTLWVAESGYQNEQGEQVIAIIPWDDWWGMALQDHFFSNPHIALLPLHPDVRARLNESAAWEFARSMVGKPYGYHNMIFSWIDTVTGNYPPPLDPSLVTAVMTIWSTLQPSYAGNMWTEALNKRLGTEGLPLAGIIAETEKRGMSFGELLTMPEQDDWVYSNGRSATCVAFILGMYKQAGVFAPFTDSIQATEFTIRDAYMLKIFEDNPARLPSWRPPGARC